MTEVSHEDEPEEQNDWTPRPPCVAFDLGQPGWPKVLVVEQVAPDVATYDARRGDDETPQLEYEKNALTGATEADPVYQVIYLTDSPLNDPKTRYPAPQSRLARFRHEAADPIDDGPTNTPWKAAALDVLESLFDITHTFGDAPSPDALSAVANHALMDTGLVQRAREASEASLSFSRDDVDEPPRLGLEDDVSVDDSEMNAELQTPEELVERAKSAGVDPDRVREIYDEMLDETVDWEAGETPDTGELMESAVKMAITEAESDHYGDTDGLEDFEEFDNGEDDGDG